MRRFARPGVVLAGYALAIGLGIVAVYLNDRTTPPDVRSTGMYGCGQLILFTGAFGFAALVPTALALWFLRRNGRVWTALSVCALSIAFLAVAAACAWPWIAPRPEFELTGFFALVSFFVAPILATAFAVAAFIAPSRGPRWSFASAAAMECVAAGQLVYWFFLRPAP